MDSTIIYHDRADSMQLVAMLCLFGQAMQRYFSLLTLENWLSWELGECEECPWPMWSSATTVYPFSAK